MKCKEECCTKERKDRKGEVECRREVVGKSANHVYARYSLHSMRDQHGTHPPTPSCARVLSRTFSFASLAHGFGVCCSHSTRPAMTHPAHMTPCVAEGKQPVPRDTIILEAPPDSSETIAELRDMWKVVPPPRTIYGRVHNLAPIATKSCIPHAQLSSKSKLCTRPA